VYINIIDLEATCWQGEIPRGQHNEVIQIGLCVLETETLTRIEKCGLYVKPMRSEISTFCTQLTGITPNDVREALTLSEAYQQLRREYFLDSRPWFSWGDYDKHQLQTEARTKNIPLKMGKHTNAKQVFASVFPEHGKLGMSQALKAMNLPLEGKHHDGADDAWNKHT
jgi:inhibitor of KinA sporulation pathway (predicted exonuclease)